MDLELWRYNGGTDATLGFLMVARVASWQFACFTCEDEHRAQKVHGETRIPAGRYQIKLRTEGGRHARYKTAFPLSHVGMLWLQDVPGFEWVYIHIGNDDDDTLGCILVGEDRNETLRNVQRSRTAYSRIYREIAAAVEREGVWITVRDLDRPQLPHP
ncbi:MAG: DUF5675 family protein [Planctomycetota bacterium]